MGGKRSPIKRRDLFITEFCFWGACKARLLSTQKDRGTQDDESVVLRKPQLLLLLLPPLLLSVDNKLGGRITTGRMQIDPLRPKIVTRK